MTSDMGMTQCECMDWARVGRMTNHHPHCKNFKEELFAQVSVKHGGCYTQPLNDLGPLIAEIQEAEAGAVLTVTIVKMAREEFDRLPEFTGH